MGKATEKFWEIESKLPNSAKKYTDRIIKKSIPIRKDTKKKGETWVQKHFGLFKKRK